MATLVALVAAAARERLLHRLAREHAEGAGHAGFQLHAHHAARGLGADELVVVGLAPDHSSEARDAGEAPGARGIAGRERKLERPGDLEHLHLDAAGLSERRLRSR